MELDAKKYEISYLVSPGVAEDDVVRVAGIITRVIEELRGVVRHVDEPKKRLLFYPIQKTRNAYSGYTTFTIDPSLIPEIHKKLKFEKEILRALIVEEEVEEPRKQSFHRRWTSTEGLPANLRLEAPRREAELTPISGEEREAAIEKIDKRLDEILGS